MAKYCMKCGAQNEDPAAFCISCGERFPEQAAAASPGQAPPRLFVAELGTGAHKHLATDVYLKDTQGTVSLVARKQSLLHDNFTIVDSSEVSVGSIQHKAHLSHSSFMVMDAGQVPLGSVNLSSMHAKDIPPGCWIEDPSGDKQATLTYADRQFAFSAIRPDGTSIFDASSPVEGIRQTLADLEHKTHDVSLFDPDFPLPLLVAVFVAVDTTPA